MEDAATFLYHLLMWKKCPATMQTIKQTLRTYNVPQLEAWLQNACEFETLPRYLERLQRPGIWNSGVEFVNRGYWPGSYVVYNVWENTHRTVFVEPEMTNQEMLNAINHGYCWTHVLVENNNNGRSFEPVESCWQKMLYC